MKVALHDTRLISLGFLNQKAPSYGVLGLAAVSIVEVYMLFMHAGKGLLAIPWNMNSMLNLHWRISKKVQDAAVGRIPSRKRGHPSRVFEPYPVLVG